jgi:insulysin
VPVKDKETLKVYWVLPYSQEEMQSKPVSYLTHLFGHEGKNSLLSYLKKEGLAIEICSEDNHMLNCYSDFELTITLTKKGLENYETVLQAVFKYAQRLREVGP